MPKWRTPCVLMMSTSLSTTSYFWAGGWGAAYDLGYSPVLGEKISEAYYAEGSPVIGGVCHGVLGFINAKDDAGNALDLRTPHDRRD